MIYGRQILRSNQPVKELVLEGIDRLKTVLLMGYARDENGESLKNYLNSATATLRGDTPFYEDKMIRRLRDVKLTDTDDSFEVARPSSCNVEQVINFIDLAGLPSVLVNQDIYEALDNVNQAALILHEGLYKVLRDEYGEKNSLRTRRAIGKVMAGESFLSTFEILKPAHVTCSSADGKTRLHAVEFDTYWTPRPDRMIGFYLEKVDGSPTMGFEKFTTGVSNEGEGTLLERFFAVVDPARPFKKRDGTGLDVTITGGIEPELDAYFETKGVDGQARRVTVILKKRATANQPLPFESELTCEMVPART